jgi:hypothetical protein
VTILIASSLVSGLAIGTPDAAFLAERLRRRVLAIVGHLFDFLARGNPHDSDGVADHVSWALFAFRAAGYRHLQEPIDALRLPRCL